MNLFKKIWNRNFLKGKESLNKMSEDIGGLEGIFSWTKIVDGKPIQTNSFKNTVTNLSKTNVIRLLAQGSSSPYRGEINASEYKLSRMRFGNTPFGNYALTYEKELAYYDPYELSARENLSNYSFGTNNRKIAGGRWHASAGKPTSSSGTLLKDSGSQILKNYISSNIEIGGPFPLGGSAFSIVIPDSTEGTGNLSLRPPSHYTLKIKLYNDSSGSDVEISQVQFSSQYFRGTLNRPTSVTGAVSPDPIGSSWTTGTLFVSDSLSAHSLSYNSITKRWVVSISLPQSISDALKLKITKIQISYQIGLYNVIKSVVPVTGFNTGSFSPSDINYYNISSSPTFADSNTSFVDDYSATFNVTMNSTEGNGVIDASTDGSNLWPVNYTEAFLFNGKDDLFSIIKMDEPFPFNPSPGTPVGFSKNSESAFLISWTVRSLV